MYRMTAITVSVVAAIGAAAPTTADADDFYAGKTITHYIGFGAGGGYDAYARLVTRHLGKYIPGNPQIVPKNMPGAGGAKAANYLTEVAPKDGTALGALAEAVALEQILSTKAPRYDAAKFNWIGRLTSTTTVFFTWHTSPSKTFEDIRQRETTIGSTGRGITAYLPKAMNKLAGAKFKLITGYRGSRDVLLALEREEVETGFGLWSQVKEQQADWLKQGKINVVVVVTEDRHRDLPNTPSVVEIGLDSDAKQILKHLSRTAAVGRSVLTTPGVPEDRVATLRAAFDKMIKDPGFLADAEKAKLSLDPAPGTRLQEVATETVNTPQRLREKLREAIR